MKKIDFLLLSIVLLITFFGFFMIYDASSFISYRDFGNKYHYIKDQSIWLALGLIGMFLFSQFNYRKFYHLALPLMLLSILLLIGVFIPGIGVHVLGAHRWINARAFILQPAEFVKFSLSVYLAAWFSTKEKGRFLSFLLLISLILGLILLEPDMGTAIIILCEAFIIYFISGGSLKQLLFVIPLIAVSSIALAIVEPYRAKRLTAFFNNDISKTSYHVKQILIALGSGGLTGVGIGNSLQKYAYLPENTTDSIFAIIAEEFGFIGSTILLILFLLLILRGLTIASSAKDTFGKLLATGIMGFLGMQIIINLGAQTALFPLTGVPLPFISYGGSSLIVDLCSIGILLNIRKQSVS